MGKMPKHVKKAHKRGPCPSSTKEKDRDRGVEASNLGFIMRKSTKIGFQISS
jgi:hypothetical protein